MFVFFFFADWAYQFVILITDTFMHNVTGLNAIFIRNNYFELIQIKKKITQSFQPSGHFGYFSYCRIGIVIYNFSPVPTRQNFQQRQN